MTLTLTQRWFSIATLLLVLVGCLGAATPPSRSATVPVYDLIVDVRPERHMLAVVGTVELPATASARRDIELTISSAAGAIRWTDPATGKPITDAAKTQTDDDGTRWRVGGAWPGGKPVLAATASGR